MRITTRGTLSQPGSAGRQVRTFPAVLSLSDSTLLASCRAGSSKDSEDGVIELYRSTDSGITWNRSRIMLGNAEVEGKRGSPHLCYLTELEPGHVLAACLWVDREAYPGKPLFDPRTEGCLPMAVVLVDSFDNGQSWSALRKVSMPEEIGPPSLTSPIARLANGSLAMSIETNKTYEDASRWYQRVVCFFSSDKGRSWADMRTAGYDPSGRIFNWDQRLCVGTTGAMAAFVWTYDSMTKTYLNIHRRLSSDNGRSWTGAEDLGFADQAGHPAVRRDGSIILPWVDRFGTRSIRVRASCSIDAGFDPATEIEIYAHPALGGKSKGASTGAMLEDQGLWTFGLPYAEALPDGDVLVFYYAGTAGAMDIHYARLSLAPEVSP